MATARRSKYAVQNLKRREERSEVWLDANNYREHYHTEYGIFKIGDKVEFASSDHGKPWKPGIIDAITIFGVGKIKVARLRINVGSGVWVRRVSTVCRLPEVRAK
jgi:hypothetical protein